MTTALSADQREPHSPPAPRWRRPDLWPHRGESVDAIDALIALASFAVFTLPILVGWTDGVGSKPAIAAFGVLAVAPLLVRRRWPMATLVAVTVVICLASLCGVRFTLWVSNAGPAIAVAVFTVADRLPRKVSLLATVAAVLATIVAAQFDMAWHPDQDQNMVQLVAAAPAWLLGYLLQTRRGYGRQLEAEARGQVIERERRVRAEERLRVSRDVHDVLSHTLSMIAVRSGVARLVADEQPDEAKRALAAIETASREGLGELRRVLNQLRDDVPQQDQSEPTLEAVAQLVAETRHPGLAIDYRASGPVAAYPALLETSAYRIVQEALTNIVKHSHASHGWVEVRHAAEELTISVYDDGRGGPASPDAGQGLGLLGMRERVSLFGGTLEAGPRAEGGFGVVARIPIDRAADDH
ncbi:sensor histidine kinase [Nocardia sp. NPDC051030]|uniref:sensor histidine kinase n=1 Tax=Nocardia sp. NPDC051030 TaxID=3155162 RepID=UPI00344A3C9D